LTGSFARMSQVAIAELGSAMRSRRAIVVLLLFAAVAALLMYCTISTFSTLEEELTSALGLPDAAAPGSVTVALWKSKPFLRFVERMVGDSLVFADIRGCQPVVLAFAGTIFTLVPFLTLLVSSPRIAEDLRNGAARYWLVRVSRTEWTLGKFFGEALLLFVAMLAGAFVAWAVAAVRLPGSSGLAMLPSLIGWSIRAWVYAFGWLGLFMGVSHLVRSGGKATALSILAMLGAGAWGFMLRNLVEHLGVPAFVLHLDVFSPVALKMMLWRNAVPAFAFGAVQLVALSLLFLSLGSAFLRRRDV